MTTPDRSATTRTLHRLDAADRELSPSQRDRSSATLERILASDPHAAAGTGAPRRTPRARPRLLLVAGAVAAAVTAVVVVPTVTGGSEAFASWSPTPVALDGAERAAALDACLVLQSNGGDELALDPGAGASALIAEARGGWNYVVFTAVGTSGRELQGSCLVPDALVADPRPGEGGFFGGLGPAEDTAGPQARNVVREDSYLAGAIEDDAFVLAEGRAGVDVVGVEVTTPGGQHVDASLDNGRWAVWWPAGDDSIDNPELTGAPTYEVTLRDGTVTDTVRTPR